MIRVINEGRQRLMIEKSRYLRKAKNKGNSEDKPEDKFYPIDDNVEDEDLPF